MKNALNWFEIPVSDFDRAKKFYESIFDYKMEVMEMPEMKMGMLPAEGEGAAGGAIVQSQMHQPAKQGGTYVYLNANPNLSDVLGRVEAAGGSVMKEKTDIGNNWGHFAFFVDSEGNNVALHSNN